VDLGIAVSETLRVERVLTDAAPIRIVCSSRDEGLHYLLDIVLRMDGSNDEERLAMHLSARVEELRVRTGETARGFADRVREIVRDASCLQSYLSSFDGRAKGIARELDARLPGASVNADPGEVVFIRGGNRQVGRFRNLTFDERVRAPTYRAVPTHQRRGAYDRPFFYYYYDPYHDLMCWVAVEEILRGGWQSDRVLVVDRTGTLMFRGDDSGSFDTTDFEVAPGAVDFDDKGHIIVDEAVPLESSVDPVEIGSPYTPGYGGDEAGG
jgi:hypothetical protein